MTSWRDRAASLLLIMKKLKALNNLTIFYKKKRWAMIGIFFFCLPSSLFPFPSLPFYSSDLHMDVWRECLVAVPAAFSSPRRRASSFVAPARPHASHPASSSVPLPATNQVSNIRFSLPDGCSKVFHIQNSDSPWLNLNINKFKLIYAKRSSKTMAKILRNIRGIRRKRAEKSTLATCCFVDDWPAPSDCAVSSP